MLTATVHTAQSPFTASDRSDDRTHTDSPTQAVFKKLCPVPKIKTSFQSWKEQQRHKKTNHQ
jgi:hypothetical protein